MLHSSCVCDLEYLKIVRRASGKPWQVKSVAHRSSLNGVAPEGSGNFHSEVCLITSIEIVRCCLLNRKQAEPVCPNVVCMRFVIQGGVGGRGGKVGGKVGQRMQPYRVVIVSGSYRHTPNCQPSTHPASQHLMYLISESNLTNPSPSGQGWSLWPGWCAIYH